MYTQPMFFPLDSYGKIYALVDGNGNTIGTGTREVCKVLLYTITKPVSHEVSWDKDPSPQRSNLRAAIKL